MARPALDLADLIADVAGQLFLLSLRIAGFGTEREISHLFVETETAGRRMGKSGRGRRSKSFRRRRGPGRIVGQASGGRLFLGELVTDYRGDIGFLCGLFRCVRVVLGVVHCVSRHQGGDEVV